MNAKLKNWWSFKTQSRACSLSVLAAALILNFILGRRSGAEMQRKLFDPGTGAPLQYVWPSDLLSSRERQSASLLCCPETAIYDSEIKFNVRLRSVPGTDLGSENETLMCFCPGWSSSTSWSRSWTMENVWASGALITVWFILVFSFSCRRFLTLYIFSAEDGCLVLYLWFWLTFIVDAGANSLPDNRDRDVTLSKR